jgi:phage repressor protein C with HTH and peptisase S24 domain
MDPVPLRLKALRERAYPSLSLRKMAELLDMPASTYAFYEDAKKYKRTYLPVDLAKRLAAVLGEHEIDVYEVFELAGFGAEESAPTFIPDIESVAQQLDLVPVKSIDQAYGLGATFADSHIEVETRWFPRQWLQSITSTSSTKLTWAPGKGGSMEPTIRDGEPVLIDMTDDRVLDQDLIWAFTIGDTAMMKRLRIRGRSVTILSDNKDVPDDHADIDEINIVGRVTHVVRRI